MPRSLLSATILFFALAAAPQEQPGYAEGRYGKAFDLDGAAHLEAPGLQDRLPGDRLTITLWVKPAAYANPRFCCAHILGLDFPSRWATHIGIDPSRPYFWSSSGIYLRDPDPLQLDQWQFLAVTYDGSTAKWFTNAILKARQSKSGSLPIGTTTRVGAGTVEARPFTGLVDDVRIFDRALSPAEIAAVMRGDTAVAPVSWFPADESATNLADPTLDGALLTIVPDIARTKALTLAEVEKMLTGGVPKQRILLRIKQFGVAFALTDAVEHRLRADGADADVLLAVSKNHKY